MATHHRHTCGGSLSTAVRDQSQPRRIRERGSTRPNLRRLPRYRRLQYAAQVDSQTCSATPSVTRSLYPPRVNILAIYPVWGISRQHASHSNVYLGRERGDVIARGGCTPSLNVGCKRLAAITGPPRKFAGGHLRSLIS